MLCAVSVAVRSEVGRREPKGGYDSLTVDRTVQPRSLLGCSPYCVMTLSDAVECQPARWLAKASISVGQRGLERGSQACCGAYMNERVLGVAQLREGKARGQCDDPLIKGTAPSHKRSVSSENDCCVAYLRLVDR